MTSSIDESIYQAFLEELHQIEKFRASHAALYGDTPLDTEDPYTKRLIESLAFFGARARVQGTRKITQIHQCLFRQYFPYLVNPLPAFGMLQLKPSIKFPEKVHFPIGSELNFQTINSQKATFQTFDSLTVFPLFFKKMEFDRKGTAGWRCLIEFNAPHICTEELGLFRFYINHLNNFLPSLTVFFTMQYCLEKVSVFYDKVTDDGLSCPITFGNESSERKVFNHIIEQIRARLHFPQQELFINLKVPPAGRRWQSIFFCFDFSDKWPETIKLTNDTFTPFVVPIVNLKLADADPVIHDGTKDNHPVLFPEPTHKFELHTVLHVLEVLQGGTKPLTPGILALGGGTYEVDYFEKRISFDLPNAFTDPKTLSISAVWTQPWFSNYINDELTLHFPEAEGFGISARLLGSLHRYENTLKNDPNFLIRVLSLKNQNSLNLNEILFIMDTMKNLNQSVFEAMPDIIKDQKIQKKFNYKQMNTLIEYEFFLRDLGGIKTELVVLFFRNLNDLLNCWLANYEVETKVHFPKFKKPLLLKGGAKNELSVLARDFFLSG